MTAQSTAETPPPRNATTSSPISALVIAKNEATRIEKCLESLAWVKEVIVRVDDRSIDDTAARASRFPNAIVTTGPWLGYGPTKEAALSQASQEWIFWIDADEVVTPELRSEIEGKFTSHSSSPLPDAFDLPRLPWFIDNWIRHGGWYPGRVVRLFRRSCGRFSEDAVHESVLLAPGSRLHHLQAELLHYSYTSLDQFFEKMVRYGPLGAQAAHKRGKRSSMIDLLLRPCYTFIRFYFFRLGFLDGRNGLIVCMGSAFSTFIRYAYLYDLERTDQKLGQGKGGHGS